MQITQKGQVTIPKEIRDKFGLIPHQEVEFIVENNKVFLKKVKGSISPFKKMKGVFKGKFSTEEIMKLTRK